MSSPVQVLLFGTFHMSNPGLDIANAEVDDVLSEHRQLEIAEVVDALTVFDPTLIAVEWPADRQGDLDTAYADYTRVGSRERSETVQLGFRLASKVGVGRVVAIDVMDEFWVPRIEKLARSDDSAARHLSALTAAAHGDANQTEQGLSLSTIGEVLRAMNTAAGRRAALAPYLVHLVPIASGCDYPGPEAVGNWYRRNFKIAANLFAAIEPGDRVVVIYGAGHVPVLEHIFDGNPGLQLVDPLAFLVPPPP